MRPFDYRGALRLLVLHLLREKPMHGYEIMKSLERLFGRAPGPGALYPQLRYLRQKGLVEARDYQRGSRRVRVYSITRAGLEYLEKHRGELDRVLSFVSSARELLDLGLRRVVELLAEAVKAYPRMSSEDREKLASVLREFAYKLEAILYRVEEVRASG